MLMALFLPAMVALIKRLLGFANFTTGLLSLWTSGNVFPSVHDAKKLLSPPPCPNLSILCPSVPNLINASTVIFSVPSKLPMVKRTSCVSQTHLPAMPNFVWSSTKKPPPLPQPFFPSGYAVLAFPTKFFRTVVKNSPTNFCLKSALFCKLVKIKPPLHTLNVMLKSK